MSNDDYFLKPAPDPAPSAPEQPDEGVSILVLDPLTAKRVAALERKLGLDTAQVIVLAIERLEQG